ncbi:hypothetical protein RRG08_008825 [Elysia crispata]|uniref:Uncharacterized protein n=1 Tax=Elysia crispata TaxID=231223 RepID=A0AAE0ZXI4_9GAST|nr:hypothetical protein RRG08_008825 [Elysia crispata]
MKYCPITGKHNLTLSSMYRGSMVRIIVTHTGTTKNQELATSDSVKHQRLMVRVIVTQTETNKSCGIQPSHSFNETNKSLQFLAQFKLSFQAEQVKRVPHYRS